ncbi:hypothetical protein [Nocardioides sp. LML1-1-1.1]|uniref:hypothetical protein n=1 Tax=Nocardioides sp. LML1-1-1.1 TaxID=3135248 RepID=UPI003416D576
MNEDRFLLRAGAWSGLAYLLVFGTGWLVLAHFFPPIEPSADAAAVAERYREHHLTLMLAAVCIMVSTVAALPVSALLVRIVALIERGAGMLTLMMGFTLATFLVLNFYSGFSFATAAFRSDRAPDLVQYANDWGFLQFMGGIPMFLMAWVLLAYAVLVTDSREDPVLPRWVGYANLWIAVLYLPELLVFFFDDGVFAWDGLIGFWIPAILFIAFFLASPFVLRPVVRRHFLA